MVKSLVRLLDAAGKDIILVETVGVGQTELGIMGVADTVVVMLMPETGDTIQTVIGAIVFHFASGDLGEALIGEPIFSGTAVERRRHEVSEFIRRGLLA